MTDGVNSVRGGGGAERCPGSALTATGRRARHGRMLCARARARGAGGAHGGVDGGSEGGRVVAAPH